MASESRAETARPIHGSFLYIDLRKDDDRMDWVQRMNEAISYIEAHITEEIDYAEAAKIACCSVYHFQRMFPFITDVSLSEYIRRRRLTLAAYELQNSDIKVIDLALKYGYDSPEAFARAFQNMHGTTPTAARQAGTKLKAYPRISFQFSMRGAAEMNYRIEEMKAFSVVGFKKQVSTQRAYEDVPLLWKDAHAEGIFDKLWNYRAQDHPIRGFSGFVQTATTGRTSILTTSCPSYRRIILRNRWCCGISLPLHGRYSSWKEIRRALRRCGSVFTPSGFRPMPTILRRCLQSNAIFPG